jgi:CheY-like chemotaxis protein/two-component sensor histidine kinase
VEKACGRAQTLTRQLLTFSCGGSPVRSLTSISDILEDAVRMALMGSSLEHELDLPDDLPAANVDAGQFHQVFNNLIINARQAMPEGGLIRVSARVETDTTLKEQIVIDISDEGDGIPEDLIAQVFDPYFTTKSEGSGLGLAIVHSIVTRHGGTVSAESSLSGGATFKITIPAARGLPASEPSAPSRADLEPGRILIMDDESTIRNFVRIALESQGCEVTEASDGAAAVKAYDTALQNKQSFHAVITDLTIPGGMGGQEAARAILAIDPDAQLIVTSGYANEPILADYEAFGFSGRLTKPFSVSDLLRVLSSIQSAFTPEQQS